MRNELFSGLSLKSTDYYANIVELIARTEKKFVISAKRIGFGFDV